LTKLHKYNTLWNAAMKFEFSISSGDHMPQIEIPQRRNETKIKTMIKKY
jgi:hypothetical protein